MTRFVLDARAILELVATDVAVAAEHELLAPTLMRSQVLSLMHEAVARGEVPAQVAKDRLRRINGMKIRLLGDAVLRRVAWQVADKLGSSSTYDAEYIALTMLQADAFVTLDAELRDAASKLVRTASLEELR